MKKSHSVFACQECGMSYPRWVGRCEGCGKWNTVVEEIQSDVSTSRSGEKVEFSSVFDEHLSFDRIKTSINEFDRVCGGGLVPGSVVLIGGDPGIGKSTLVLQISGKINDCYYFSGEESIQQVIHRANRLQITNENLKIASCNTLGDIFSSVVRKKQNQVVIIDSIQTLTVDSGISSAGTVTQIRTCTQEIINFAKSNAITFIIIGHVTKEGFIAGPKLLEHMVDAVFYFEGEKVNNLRILRSIKNRYGPCDEIGVFEVSGTGLIEVENPSKFFVSERVNKVPGVVNFVSIEGTRPILVEIQALVVDSWLASPRRSVVGIDVNRLYMILAVIESVCKISFSKKDVYISVIGGVKVTEPAADLAIAVALLSVLKNEAVEVNSVVIGEIGLTGEIRPVFDVEPRIREAAKLGMKRAFIADSKKRVTSDVIEISYFKNILLVLSQVFSK